MQRAVTAIYRTHAVADLVRKELADLGISRGHVSVIPDDPNRPVADAYRDDTQYNDDLHDLHLPESDFRTYQQAVRRGDYVVSVNVNDDAHLDDITRIMRRPEDAYDIDELDTEYRDAEYIPRRGTTSDPEQGTLTGTSTAGAGMAGATTGTMGTGYAADERYAGERYDMGDDDRRVRAYTRKNPMNERNV